MTIEQDLRIMILERDQLIDELQDEIADLRARKRIDARDDTSPGFEPVDDLFPGNHFDAYAQKAMRTRNDRLTPYDTLNHAIDTLVTEAAEVCDIRKKVEYQGKVCQDLAQEYIDEAGDILWGLAELAYALNVPLSHIANHNIAKLQRRYPKGFEPNKT